MKHLNVPEVGAPDPDAKNSPIVDYELEEGEFLDVEADAVVCYFNNVEYRVGDYVCSGNELLCCEKGGVWSRKGSCYE